MNPNRDYSVDLLRIISMFMVIIIHIDSNGGVLEAAAYSPTHYWSVQVLHCLCYCAVDIFGLISGYFGFKSKWKLTNIFVLWLTVACYSVAFEFLYRLIVSGTVNFHNILWAAKKALSAINGNYWFFKAYFLMFFFMPFMNKAVTSMTMREHGFAAALLTLVTTVGSSLFEDVFSIDWGRHALWLAILYIDGAFLAKYRPLKRFSSLQLFAGFFTCFGIKILFEVFDQLIRPSHLALGYASLAVLGEAVFALTLFTRVDLSETFKKIVSVTSPLAFSVYIIHENIRIREMITDNLFSCLAHLPSGLMIICILLSALAIFIICASIDSVRKMIFDLLKIKQRAFAAEEKLKAKIGLIQIEKG